MEPTIPEIARLFLKLGTIGFGGPAAHIALMDDEVVRKRRWLSREEFLDLLGATNLIPGPNSTEMAIHIGYRKAGFPGLLVAGACFILPATLIVTAIAWAYVRFGSLPEVTLVFRSVKPVMVASVELAPIFLFFLKIGSVLFGSGYVLLAFLRADLVERWHWLSEGQLLDAIAVGQVTPGPVFTTATFIGYLLAGMPGAAVATVGIFLPAFVFVAISGPLVRRIRGSQVAGAVLDGVNLESLYFGLTRRGWLWALH
jgi:chromate transport protein ChrA